MKKSENKELPKEKYIEGILYSGYAIKVIRAAPESCGICNIWGKINLGHTHPPTEMVCTCARGEYFSNLPPSI